MFRRLRISVVFLSGVLFCLCAMTAEAKEKTAAASY